MAASSVTGRGQGMSNGKKKPLSNCGCCCTGKVDPVVATPPARTGCYKNYQVGGGGSYKAPSGGGTSKTCS